MTCKDCGKEIKEEYFSGVNGLICADCLKSGGVYYTLKKDGYIKTIKSQKGVAAMYIINEKAGQAAKIKGFAEFPEDFERLPKASGAAFVWWRDGDNIKIETTLNGDDLQNELKALKKELGA